MNLLAYPAAVNNAREVGKYLARYGYFAMLIKSIYSLDQKYWASIFSLFI